MLKLKSLKYLKENKEKNKFEKKFNLYIKLIEENYEFETITLNMYFIFESKLREKWLKKELSEKEKEKDLNEQNIINNLDCSQIEKYKKDIEKNKYIKKLELEIISLRKKLEIKEKK